MPRSDGRSRRVVWAWGIVIAGLAVGSYLHTLGNAFVFDDRIIVLAKARKWQDESLWQVLKHDYWGDQRMDALYRPVTVVSHVLSYRVWGDRPGPHRAVNLVLHAACCCCLFGLTCVVFGDRRLAGIASVLFAVHAVHVEAVAQVVGRAELLAALGTIVALWLYVSDARLGRRRPTWRYVVALFVAALAMLSKESGTVVIALAAFYDLWSMRFGVPGRGQSGAVPAGSRSGSMRWSTVVRRLALQRWVALLVVGLIVLIIRQQVLGQLFQDRGVIDKVDNPIAHASGVGRALTSVVLLGKYVGLLIWPHPLCHDYSYNALPICETPVDGRFVWGMVCLAAIVVGGVWSYRCRGGVLWSIAWFLLTYALVSNTVVLSGTIFAERLMYLPSSGFCWLVAVGAVAAGDRLSALRGDRRRGWWIVGGVLVALCAVHVVLTVQRGRTWRGERSLITSALRLTNDSVRIQMQAGAYARHDKDVAKSMRHFGRAAEILDDHAPAHLLLGEDYLRLKQPEGAIPHLLKCVGNLPAEANYRAADYLFQAYRAIGKPQEAEYWRGKAEEFKKALR